MATDLEALEKLFIKHKTNKLGFRGACYDCGKEIVVNVDVDENGKVKVAGGAVYFTKWGDNLLKCESCFAKDRVLHRKVDVYSRVVGYMRPIDNWNVGKKEEWKNRKTVKFNTQDIT